MNRGPVAAGVLEIRDRAIYELCEINHGPGVRTARPLRVVPDFGHNLVRLQGFASDRGETFLHHGFRIRPMHVTES